MNLQQAKALFFAQYLGQKVFNDGEGEYLYPLYSSFLDVLHERHYLQLRSVSQLTDKELEVFAKQSAYRLDEKNKSKIGKAMINHLFELNKWSGSTILFLTDYQRSIGVLIPFTYLNEENKPVTLQPDEIIKLGWAKIKE